MRPTFLAEPETTPRVQELYDTDLADHGYVMNLTRVWAHQPDTHEDLFALIDSVARQGGLTLRERGILVSACASTLGDSYCSLAWGRKLSREADPTLAASVLAGRDEGLSEAERAMASWARLVAADPNGTTRSDVDALRSVGYPDSKIFAITVYVALRIAFLTVNDALGGVPDDELVAATPREVVDAVAWGRQWPEASEDRAR